MVTVPGRSWFDVAHVEPGRSLVLRASLDLRGRPFDPRDERPRGFVDSRWEFFLDSPGDGTTRLLVRSGSASGPRPWSDIIDLVFWHPAHVIMQIRQLRQIKSRVERQVAAPLVVEPRGVARSRTSPPEPPSRPAARTASSNVSASPSRATSAAAPTECAIDL